MMKNVSALHLAALSWLLCVVVIVSFAFSKGAVFDSSIISLLPESEQQPVVQQATEKMAERFSRHLVLMLAGEDEEKVRTAVISLAENLTSKPEVAKVVWSIGDDDISRYRDELYPFRFSVLDESMRQLLLAGSYEQIRQQALFRLFSPLSITGGKIIEDPFGLFSEFFLNRKNELNIQVSNALFKVVNTGTTEAGSTKASYTKALAAESRPVRYMLMVTLAGDPFSPALQSEVLGAVEAQKKMLSRSGVSIRMSGMLMHAQAGAQQAGREISTIGIGSLLGIMIVMLLVFRRFKPLLLMLFSIVVGCISAAAVTMLVFDRVHLITFAFGAGLVGVAIDYALHYLCEYYASSSGKVLRRILPGLLLGLFSSVIAYSAQALAPFPGLRQMAVFSVVGLTAAWLTVVLWFPLLTPVAACQPLSLAHRLDKLRRAFPRVDTSPLLIVLLLIVFAVAVKSLWGSDAVDDIRLLQTSPDSLLAQEKEVQQALGISSSSQFLLVTADTMEQCLQKEERLASALDDMKSDGALESYQALSSVLPSLKRQAENSEMVRLLYEQQLAAFYAVLKVSGDDLSSAQVDFERSSEKRLTAEAWLQMRASESWKNLIIMQSGSTVATVIRFTGALDDTVKSKLMDLAATDAGVTYVDKIQNISELMAAYRLQIAGWLMLAYIFVLIVLLYRYKQQVWRVVLPPLFASIVTLAILLQVEQGLNLFHLMALILVLGIGIDMGIFLMETDDASHTWLAVSLSAYTSILAFGMLAWSETPVLHHFGLTVLLGLTIVWLVTPLMRKNNFSG